MQEQTMLAKRISSYDEEQKKELVVLGQSNKPWNDILASLGAKIEMSTQMANFRHLIPCFKNDGVYQLNQAIEAIYGSAKAGTDERPSGGGSNLETVDVQLANGVRKKVPYGRIDLPDCGEDAAINIGYDHTKNLLHVTGSCQMRFSAMVDEIIELTKEYLNTQSIYKNQAIELDANFTPKIMNLANIDKEFMILSEKTEYDLNGLMARVRHADRCKAKGIPLKTGILMEGPYGTGKTLLAFKIAAEAIQNGWVFVYLKDPTLLAKTLKLCQTLDNNGHGVIVFLEDVDQVTRGDRDADMQDILNTLDGGDTKQMNVIALFSTNHIELIEPTFLRGKRIGSVISLGALDAATAKKYLQYTFKDQYDMQEEGMDAVCEMIAAANIVPAFMAEITETIKSNLIFKDDSTVTAKDVQFALESYKRQVELSQKKDMSKTNADILQEALANAVFNENIKKQMNEIHVACCD